MEVTEQATAVHSSALTLSEFGIKYKVEKTWLKHPEVISTHISNAGNSFPCRPSPAPLQHSLQHKNPIIQESLTLLQLFH